MSRYPTIEAVADFLVKTGWAPIEGSSESLQRFTRADEVVALPLRQEYADFELRMEVLLSRLGASEELSLVDFPDRVNQVAFDNVTWTVSGDELKSSIPLSTLETALQSIKKLHIYAAASLEQRVAMHGRRVSRRARGVGERLRLGPTVPGSYVLPVRFESSADLETRLLSQLSETNFAPFSFEQRSMELLLGAVREIERILSPNDNLNPPTDLEIVRNGLSHEFVLAFVELLKATHVNQVAVSGTVYGRSAASVWTFSTGALPRLETLATRLFQVRLEGVDDVRGVVVSLRRNSPGEGGTVRVRRKDMGEKGTVLLVELGESDYLLASEADAAGSEIEIRGLLISEPRSLPRLVSVERVTIPNDRFF